MRNASPPAPAERKREEDGVARRNVGDGDILSHPAFRHVDIRGQGGAAESAEIERKDDVAFSTERERHSLRCLELDAVALAVIDGEREQAVALFDRGRRSHHRIEPSGDEHDRLAR